MLVFHLYYRVEFDHAQFNYTCIMTLVSGPKKLPFRSLISKSVNVMGWLHITSGQLSTVNTGLCHAVS